MKTIKKIIFLVVSPFSQRDFNRFGIDVLEKNGFEVEVWDLTVIFYPDRLRNHASFNPANWFGYKICRGKKPMLKEISNLKSAAFIIAASHNSLKLYPVYKAISDNGCEYMFFMANTIPSGESNKIKKFLGYVKKVREIRYEIIGNRIFSLIPFSWLKIKPPQFILAGGEGVLEYLTKRYNSSEIIWAHTLDYDIYSEEKDIPFTETEKPKAVFIEGNLFSHPDCIERGVSMGIAESSYYSLLNSFFDLVENNLGFEVVIAAHPRSPCENQSGYFVGRKLFKDETAKLIKKSRLVLAHGSTAVNFANLFCKPVIFLTSSKIDKSFEGPLIRAMAQRFGKSPIFMDKCNNVNWNFELRIDKAHYDKYRRAYIKTDHSENLPFWQIVANRFKQEAGNAKTMEIK